MFFLRRAQSRQSIALLYFDIGQKVAWLDAFGRELHRAQKYLAHQALCGLLAFRGNVENVRIVDRSARVVRIVVEICGKDVARRSVGQYPRFASELSRLPLRVPFVELVAIFDVGVGTELPALLNLLDGAASVIQLIQVSLCQSHVGTQGLN